MSTAVVAGALANKAGSGGEAWVRMSWMTGLSRLGFDTYFVEELPADAPHLDRAVAYFKDVTAWFGVSDRSTLLVAGAAAAGPSVSELMALAPSAGLVNISGHLRSPRLLERFRTRVYVDIDPGFTQIWHASGHHVGLAGHDAHFTIGVNIGSPRCDIPTGGIAWRPVHQPVVLDDWPVLPLPDSDRLRFTTVSNWRTPSGALTWDGTSFDAKHHQFRKLIRLPQRVSAEFELALAIDPSDAADRAALEAHGWQLEDPRPLGDPAAFRDYVRASGAEFSVCQGIYAATTSGWFSDRTIRYLASGRPAVVQDTGVTGRLAVGVGVVPFTSLEEAVAAVEAVAGDPTTHAEAARHLAEETFAHDLALRPVADQLDT